MGQADITGLDGLDAFQQQLLEESAFILGFFGVVFVVGFILLAAFTIRLQSRPLDWKMPLSILSSRPWVLRDVMLVALPLVLVQAVYGLIYRNFFSEADPSSDRLALALQGVLFHWLCFALIWILMWRRGITWRDAFGLAWRGGARHALWGAAILLGVMPVIMAGNVVIQVIMQYWGITPQIQDVTRIISSASGWMAKAYFFALAVVIAPVVEEMLFRGMLLPALAKKVGVKPALLVVGLLFSLVHGFYMPAGVVFFMLSVAFSLAYIYRGSLLVPIIMHAIFNGFTIVVLFRL